jgi:PBSX family phage terminase large subunit
MIELGERKQVEIRLHEGQEKALRSRAKYTAVIAGTGSGKTYLGPVWLTREITKRKAEEVLVIAPTYMMFQRVVLPGVKNFFENLNMIAEYKVTERTMTLKNGTRIYFGSADKPFSLEGVHVDCAWMDEAGQMRREAWDVVKRRVGAKDGRILITTTPYNLGWLKTEVYDQWKAGNKDFEVIQFASIENPFYPREEFERARKLLPEWKFRMFYLGEFVRPEGMVYPDFNSSHIIDPFDIPHDWIKIAGVDIGYNNPTAVVFIAIDKDGVAYVYREYYQRYKTTDEVVKDLKEMTEGENIDAIYVDPSEPAFIKSLRINGFNALPADNDVLAGISVVTSYIRSNRLFVFRGVVNLIDEMENYRWKMQNDEVKDEPVKEYDHAVDALRYALYTRSKILSKEDLIKIVKEAKFYE